LADGENDLILDVKNLEVKFYHDQGVVSAVNGVDFNIGEGQSIGFVGESACGKTVTASTVLRILPPSGDIINGTINFRDTSGQIKDLAQYDSDSSELRKIRGNDIAMIFQEPMTAFSPVHTLYNQISEAILLHQDLPQKEVRARVINLLDQVGIPEPEERVDDYSFEFSGGMRQRAMIAMALACEPRILIADEPTTALDVTIQAQVLKLIKDMQQDYGLSLHLITHDLGVIAHMVDYVYIMYLGRIVEKGPIQEVFLDPKHPYTRDLLGSIPSIKGVEGKIASIQGSVPDAYHMPPGCSFHPRCRDVVGDKCSSAVPQSVEIEPEHYTSCYKYTDRGVKENVKHVR